MAMVLVMADKGLDLGTDKQDPWTLVNINPSFFGTNNIYDPTIDPWEQQEGEDH